MIKQAVAIVFLYLGLFSHAYGQLTLSPRLQLPVQMTRFHVFGDKVAGFPENSQSVGGNSWSVSRGFGLFISKEYKKFQVDFGAGFTQDKMRVSLASVSIPDFKYKPIYLIRDFAFMEVAVFNKVNINTKVKIAFGLNYRFSFNSWKPFFIDTLNILASPRTAYSSEVDVLNVYFTSQSRYDNNHQIGFGLLGSCRLNRNISMVFGTKAFKGIKSQWFTSAYELQFGQVESRYHVFDGSGFEITFGVLYHLAGLKMKDS